MILLVMAILYYGYTNYGAVDSVPQAASLLSEI